MTGPSPSVSHYSSPLPSLCSSHKEHLCWFLTRPGPDRHRHTHLWTFASELLLPSTPITHFLTYAILQASVLKLPLLGSHSQSRKAGLQIFLLYAHPAWSTFQPRVPSTYYHCLIPVCFPRQAVSFLWSATISFSSLSILQVLKRSVLNEWICIFPDPIIKLLCGVSLHFYYIR